MFISIITPVYNRETEIARCIRSVAGQVFSDYEHIIINDGSDDNTYNVVKKFTSISDKIKCLSYAKNRGVNYARNLGVKSSVGKFLLFLDSDDQLLENSLTKIANTIINNRRYEHFLFMPPNKDNVGLDSSVEREVYYKDWISGNFSGDYTLVIKKHYLQVLPFLEEFRAYEGLNLLRICKISEPQFFSPNVVVDIERSRQDSLTKAICKKDTTYYDENFRKNTFIIKTFYDDYMKYGEKYRIRKLICKTIMYATIASKKEDMRSVIDNYIKINAERLFYLMICTLLNNRLTEWIRNQWILSEK